MGIFAIINIVSFLSDPTLTFKDKMFRIVIPIIVVMMIFSLIMYMRKESFIGTDMWYGQAQRNSQLVSKKERSDDLVKISKGYLPGERPKENLLENFENIGSHYNPRNYEIEPDYHRTVQQFGVDPNPIESLETPDFMIPKTYKTSFNYENLKEVGDNNIDAMKLNTIESTFRNIEKNKFYKDLLRSKCRGGNRSSADNCGCKKPFYGEF